MSELNKPPYRHVAGCSLGLDGQNSVPADAQFCECKPAEFDPIEAFGEATEHVIAAVRLLRRIAREKDVPGLNLGRVENWMRNLQDFERDMLDEPV